MYDMNEMTAAHTTLPLPTWVEVTNVANGKRIVVKVNDRGPFVGKRVIDLSYAAATKLDIVGPGTALVEVRALPGPPAVATAARRADRREKPAQARAATAEIIERPATPVKPRAASPTVVAPAAPARSERLFAEAGRFTRRADATELIATLKAEGFVNAFVVTEDRRRKSVHRVRVGPLPGEADVERVGDQLRELGARRSHSVVMP